MAADTGSARLGAYRHPADVAEFRGARIEAHRQKSPGSDGATRGIAREGMHRPGIPLVPLQLYRNTLLDHEYCVAHQARLATQYVPGAGNDVDRALASWLCHTGIIIGTLGANCHTAGAMLLNRWDSVSAGSTTPSQAIHVARLIGAEPELVLHGGGNTSFKETRGRRRVLHVKGSGANLADVTERDYVAIDLDPLLPLLQGLDLDNQAMHAALARHVLAPAEARPSIETLMHAGLPYPHVLHTHAAAVLAMSNTVGADRHLAAAFGERAPVVPYRHSGAALARACVAAHAGGTVSARGLVLAHHGLVAWGDSAQAAYEATLELCERANRYLDARGAARPGQEAMAASPLSPKAMVAIAEIRAAACRIAGRKLVATVRNGAAISAFARRHDVAALTAHGPSTPGHAIHTKRVPLIGADVAAFASCYRAYLGGAVTIDCAPRIVLDPGFGMLALGVTKQYADIAADIFIHDAAIMARVAAYDSYTTISAKDMRAAELEYAGHEDRVARELPRAGQVHVIDRTGERSEGIAALLRQGASVVALDTDAQVAKRFDGHACLGLAARACDPAAVLEAIVRAFGGIDVAHTGPDWQQALSPIITPPDA